MNDSDPNPIRIAALLAHLDAIRRVAEPLITAARDMRNHGRHPNTPVTLTLEQCRAIADAITQEES